MEVTLAVSCDYANVSQEGKLNILGVFQEVNPPVLPFALPQMYLVVSFEAVSAEFGTEKQVRIALLEEDGSEVMSMDGAMQIPHATLPGGRVYINQVLGLQGISFADAGDYAFYILVGGETKRVVPLRINEPIGEGGA